MSVGMKQKVLSLKPIRVDAYICLIFILLYLFSCGGRTPAHWAFKNTLWVRAVAERRTLYLPAHSFTYVNTDREIYASDNCTVSII